jgi:putative membrane protein
MGEKHTADMAKLSKLSGAEFDREWLRTQIEDHKTEIELFQAQATQQGKQTPLNKFAQAQLPILQGHLQHAQSLQAEIAGTASAK